MSYRLIFYGLIFLAIPLFAQDKVAYRIFSSEGKEVKYEKMIRSLNKAEVIFFGELHNDPISHWLELQVAKSLYEANKDLLLGLEMFEADDQLILDEYLQGVIEEKNFLNEVKIWDNYQTDYRPLIEFVRQRKLHAIASNIPRRYANLVYRKGLASLDTLDDVSRKWIAPLPIEVDLGLKGYKKMIEEMAGHGTGSVENLAKSQAVKDATMAYFILYHKHHGNKILHINGVYHSQDGEGIVWYVKKSSPLLKVATIAVVEQADLEKLEETNIGKSDFIVCVPNDMTKTY
jgi:uncharacterized iron-regulated protein